MFNLAKLNIMKSLPKCNIIDKLVEKNNSRINQDLDYVQLLVEFKKIVAIEVSRINELFPEYTPHDENYHLKRLFLIADELLGDKLIEQMNVTELFMLSISLYAHDWGMSISVEEKAVILHNRFDDRFSLLDDEQIRLMDFCQTKETTNTSLSIENWREYVRLTHAFRSGKRIKHHFETINLSIADYACRICEGHWLDFNIIEDYTSYPTDASINRDIVNVKALTLYVRLADLLDLGEDRTPFVLWKFVAPRNSISKMEWQKHRCLQPVTFPQYQNGRYIQVDGSTNDHNVYMSIKDMERYINEQFRFSSDILNRMNHAYHKLDISHITWRIAPIGFEPIAIQFEFERNRMFDILSDDIYNGNPYVFIRELLQNAIDAIQMRLELLSKLNDVTFSPNINISIDEDSEKYIVQISDNGIGMDKYIIKNYLAVAGKSYYKSSDFRKEGLKMDPISRFGIGILSCFMVANYIEIETRKDPNISGKSESLKICIPAKENYFKINKELKQLKTGTTFRIFVLKSKLPKKSKTNLPIDMNFTDYIGKIAAFCKFQITITEKNISTTILNPNDKKNTQDSQVQQLNYSFPFEKALLPQYVGVAKEYFEEHFFHLKKDLGLDNYDGCITYLLPKSEKIDIANVGHVWPVTDINIINIDDPNSPSKKIKWHDDWVSFDRYLNEYEYVSDKSYNVYIDGIKIVNIAPPEIESTEKDNEDDLLYNSFMLNEHFISPLLNINMSKPSGMKIDLARTNIKTDERWDIPIWKAFFQYLKNNIIDLYYKQNCKDRLLSFSKLLTYYRVPSRVLIMELIEEQHFPLLYLSEQGVIEFNDNSLPDFIKLIPCEADRDSAKAIYSCYAKGTNYNGVLNNWVGEKVLIGILGYYHSNSSSCSLINMLKIHREFIFKNYYFHSIEFVTSSFGEDFPLVSEIVHRKLSKNDEITIENICNLELNNISEYQLYCLSILLKKKFEKFPKIVRFPSPFQNKIIYSYRYLNLNHEFSKKFIKLCAIIAYNTELDPLNCKYAILLDLVNDIPFIARYLGDDREINISELNVKVNNLFCKAFEYGVNKTEEQLFISLDDFVPNSISINNETKNFRLEYDKAEIYFKENSKWGLLIQK